MSKDIPLNEEGEVIPLNELQHVQEGVLPVALSPMQQMQQAKEMGMSVEEMKEMLALQKEYEANEARKAFHVALAEFKKNPPQVVKDKMNAKYGSAYATLGNMVNTVNEAMGPFGLSARWDYPETTDNTLKVTCILSHTLGHEESVTLTGAPDTSGSKNIQQERKAGRTYLKLETFEAVTGMASVDGNIDDDGNSAGPSKAPEPVIISTAQLAELDKIIEDNGLDSAIFSSWLSKKIPYTKGDWGALWVDHFAMVKAQLEKSAKQKSK